MPEELIEQLGKLADKADNFYHASRLPMPDRVHRQALTEAMIDIRNELRDIVREYSEDDPWEGDDSGDS